MLCPGSQNEWGEAVLYTQGCVKIARSRVSYIIVMITLRGKNSGMWSIICENYWIIFPPSREIEYILEVFLFQVAFQYFLLGKKLFLEFTGARLSYTFFYWLLGTACLSFIFHNLTQFICFAFDRAESSQPLFWHYLGLMIRWDNDENVHT